MTEEGFLEFLSRRHFMPSFNLPIDSIVFVARGANNDNEEIEAKMSNGLEKALTGYAPGKKLMYLKKEFSVGGLYHEFPPSGVRSRTPDAPLTEQELRAKMTEQINRFRYWFTLPENISWYHMCRRCMHTLESQTSPDETPELGAPCQMCESGDEPWISKPLIRPPGFAPVVRTIQNGWAPVNPETFSDTPTYRLSTRWPTQIQDLDNLGDDCFELGDEGARIGLLEKMQIVDVNPGIADLSEPDRIGFDFCKDCGRLDVGRLNPTHHRPYAITYNDGMYCGIRNNPELSTDFENDRTERCNPGEAGRSIEGHHRLILGRRFTSDLLVLDVPWPDAEFIAITSDDEHDHRPLQARAAANSICQALIQVTTSGNCGLAISPSDINGDIRLYRDEEKGTQGFHIFLYERSDGGTGLLRALYQRLEEQFEDIGNPGSVLADLISGLSGERCSTDFYETERVNRVEVRSPCDSICNGCLQDFTTQHMAGQLNRELGYHLLLRSLFGELGIEQLNLRLDYMRLRRLLTEAVRDLGLDYEVETTLGDRSEAKPASPEDDDLPDEITQAYRSISYLVCGGKEFTVASTLADTDPESTTYNSWRIENDPEWVINSIKRHLGGGGGAGDRLRRARLG